MLLTRRLPLRPRETIVAIVRRSLLAYAWSFALGSFLILLTAFSSALLIAWGRIGGALVVLLLILGVLLCVRSWWMWYWTAFVVTNIRVIDIDQRYFFHRRIAEARLDRVEEVTVEMHGVVAAIAHLGAIRLQTAGAMSALEIRSVRRPERVADLLGRLHEEAAHANIVERRDRMMVPLSQRVV